MCSVQLQLLLSFLGLLSFSVADYVLYTGEVLLAGQNLTNGRHHLSLEPNCDLVLYNNGFAAWRASAPSPGGDCYLALRQNGELVVRRNVHYTLWSSGSKSKKGKYALVLNEKGKIEIYGQRRWTTNNNKEKVQRSRSVVSTAYVLYSGQRVTSGERLVYEDYELGLPKCNLVIRDTSKGTILWQTSTSAITCSLEVESDGELVLKHKSQRLWTSGRKGESGAYVGVLQFDGRLSVFGPLLWTNDRIQDADSAAI